MTQFDLRHHELQVGNSRFANPEWISNVQSDMYVTVCAELSEKRMMNEGSCLTNFIHLHLDPYPHGVRLL